MKAKKYSWQYFKRRGACYTTEQLRATLPEPMTLLEILALKIPIPHRLWAACVIPDDPALQEWRNWRMEKVFLKSADYITLFKTSNPFNAVALRKLVAILKARDA